jgi:hypothetical protein
MTRCFAVAAGALAAAAVFAGAAAAHAASVLCVGGPHCFDTIQAAVAASHDGDTITVGPGTYAGGIVIETSISLVGAGAHATVIRGGGPVIQIGDESFATEPNVSIRGVTITGGNNTSVPNAWDPFGGGVFVAPPLGPDGPGLAGNVTISDSVITGNRVSNSDTVDFGIPCPGGIECPGADPQGGGIASWGNLTLKNTSVSGNVATTPDFFVAGGGIMESSGSLTLENSQVNGNTASGTPPYALHAEGGGISIGGGGALTMRNSSVSGNATSVANSLPFAFDGGHTLEVDAHGGGISAGDGPVTLDNSHLDGNVLRADVPNGEPVVYDAAMCVCGSSLLTMRNSTASGNTLVANLASSDDAGASGGILEADGPAALANVRVSDNKTTVTSDGGGAQAIGTFVDFDQGPDGVVVANSEITRNSVIATSDGGAAEVFGAGVINNGVLQLVNSRVDANIGAAYGAAGFAEGGGIWNGVVEPGPGPNVSLSLSHTSVNGNRLLGSSAVLLRGGGLYTLGAPASLDHSRVAGNVPDDCTGC